MVRIVVDQERCSANGVCTSVAPGWFVLDDDDQLTADERRVPDEALELVREAVLMCPTQALSLIDDLRQVAPR